MSKWEMGYGLTLEQRAKNNGRDIDVQWIKENEANEYYRGSINKQVSKSKDEEEVDRILEKLRKDGFVTTSKEMRKLKEDLLKERELVEKKQEPLIDKKNNDSLEEIMMKADDLLKELEELSKKPDDIHQNLDELKNVKMQIQSSSKKELKNSTYKSFEDIWSEVMGTPYEEQDEVERGVKGSR